MTDEPQRFVDLDAMTPEDHAHRHKTGLPPETAEWREAQHAAGRTEDDPPVNVEDWTPADHARARYGDAA